MSLALIRCEYLLPDVQELACVEGHVILNCLQHILQSVTELATLLSYLQLYVSTCLLPGVPMSCEKARTSSFGAFR
jgi:hypothetical protein